MGSFIPHFLTLFEHKTKYDENSSVDADSLHDRESQHDEQSAVPNSSGEGIQVDFQKIYKALPELVGREGSISVQTCFLTLLHLANEQKLKFVSIEDGLNFQVFKE